MMKEKGKGKPSTKTEKDSETKIKRTKVKNFFGRVGYSVWLIVMIVGGVLAFLVSLFLL